MFRRVISGSDWRQGCVLPVRGQLPAAAALLLAWALLGITVCEGQPVASIGAKENTPGKPLRSVTNVVQFRALSGRDYLGGCAFQLAGVMTLVDTNRNLVVLQDATGAVALFNVRDSQLRVGQLAAIDGADCRPYVVSFPDFPHRPSGRDLRPAFEAPSDWGDYYLTRMRGYLHPSATGEYTFWIASDNSSELWLSADDAPSSVKKVAFIPHFGWVNPHEWSHFPSQRSDPILLKGGHSYYIEAYQEQTTFDSHLSVAWQGPGLEQSVIAGAYLTPWTESDERGPIVGTNGILREYWTNFSAGDVAFITGPRPFESALSVKNAHVSVLGPGETPKPVAIMLNQRLLPEDNYRWVEVEGRVNFAGMDGATPFLELSDGLARMQIRMSNLSGLSRHALRNATIRVNGVCEGVYDPKGGFVAGIVWASVENSILVMEPERPNLHEISLDNSSPFVQTNTNPAMGGFYATGGVVTFNDHVADRDFLFVQDNSAPVLVSLKGRNFKHALKAGQWVELGGTLQPSKGTPVISPLALTERGWRSMPIPATLPVQLSEAGNSEGRWTEVEGVVHSVNTNDMLVLMGKTYPVSIWIGGTSTNDLSRYVDARLRVRGVLSLRILESPLLLVPSRDYLDVEEEAPISPFGIPLVSIANLDGLDVARESPHRVRVAGTVTYSDGRSFFVQDHSRGLCVQAIDGPKAKIGDGVDVVGFPTANGPGRILTDALARTTGVQPRLEPRKLNFGESTSLRQGGMLVHTSGKLLQSKTSGTSQRLELQENQRVFEAILTTGRGSLPSLVPGSRVGITGVCDFGTTASTGGGRIAAELPSAGLLRILLRGPSDVELLAGPSWWTLKRTAALIGALLSVIVGTLLWVRILHWRLARQQAAQLAFSRQILQSQESERRRIAANLHDSLGQNLLVIKNQARLAMQPAANAAALRRRLDEITNVASQSIEEVRQITLGLRPYHLERLGLSQAIRATVNRASENSAILFASHVDDIDSVFTEEFEIHLYRIAQEAVSNVLKHSRATEAAVVVKRHESAITLSIRDNGRGFDSSTVHFRGFPDVGHGLGGVTERTRILGGKCVIDSQPGQGTTLTVEISMPVAQHATQSETTHCG
jgi:signal transduction histidine kinase